MSRARPLDDRRVFIAARRVPRDRRDAFVAKVCRENAELRARVEQLLAAAEQPSVFIRPPTGVRGFVADGPGATSTTARTKRHPPLAAGTRIAERYRVESTIGEGSSGRVYRGTDEVLKTTVAIKMLDLEAGAELERLRREAATLRWLRVPGVVNLQDDGVDEGRPYIVTDLVEGAPFPGSPTAMGPRRWEEIRETAVGVLETLARIHAQGVIHGDLKPANVLVDARGIPTVLDVGIASGPSIDFGESETLFAGTPSYMAPERIVGGPATVATDLYAVGVMLHQALVGEVPHHAATRTRLFDRRRNDSVEPIRTRAPEVPPDAARMIDALLSRDPSERPASAYDALDLLEHLRYVRPGNPEYPWLGSRALIDTLVQAAKDGRSMDIWGPPGSGKTRTLREAAKEIEALGRKVVWVSPSGEPFGSLMAAVALDTRSLGRGLEEAGREMTARITTLLAAGHVVVADDADRLDRWSRAVLDACRPAGATWSTGPKSSDQSAPVPPLVREDLRPLFSGFDAIFHIPEDAASALWARTGGRPGAAMIELAAWVRAGLATWEADSVRISRRSIERLTLEPIRLPCDADPTRPLVYNRDHDLVIATLEAAGDPTDAQTLADATSVSRSDVDRIVTRLEADGVVARRPGGAVELRREGHRLALVPTAVQRTIHSRLADSNPASPLRRIRHLRSAGRLIDFGIEVAQLPEAHCRRNPRYLELVSEAFRAVVDRNHALADRLAARVLRAALWAGAKPAIDVAVHHLTITGSTSIGIRWAATIARAAIASLTGRSDEALNSLASLPADLSPALRVDSYSVRIFAARTRPVEVEADLIRSIAAESLKDPSLSVSERLDDWLGWLRYRQGAFAEAAELHARQADRELAGSPAHAAALLAAASALLELGALDRAATTAALAKESAAASRVPALEARAIALSRSIRVRRGDVLPPDVDFISAVRELGQPHVEARVMLTEAAIAWRGGAREMAAAWAFDALTLGRQIAHAPTAALAGALCAHLSRSTSSASAEEAWALAGRTALPGIVAQVAALVAGALSPDARESCVRLGRDACDRTPPELRALRRELVSIDEATVLLDRSSRRDHATDFPFTQDHHSKEFPK